MKKCVSNVKLGFPYVKSGERRMFLIFIFWHGLWNWWLFPKMVLLPALGELNGCRILRILQHYWSVFYFAQLSF